MEFVCLSSFLKCPTVKNVVVVQRAGTGKINMEPGRDTWWHDEMNAADVADYCEPEKMDADCVLNANGKDNDRNALVVKFSLDREDGVVMEHA